MKEDKKYYTPSIDEFYIGFGYERIHELKHYNDTWKSVEVTHKDNTFMRFVDDLQDNRLRIKYLDKEDIESLGWDSSPDEPDEWYWSLRGNMDIQLYYDDKTRIATYDGIGVTIYMDTSILFNGYIKNKSELKKLMKQLGIDEH